MKLSNIHRPLGTLLVAAGLGGCGLGNSLLRDQAVTEFTTQYSCPENRLKVQRIDMHAPDILTAPEPPPAIAQDPERRALHQQQSADRIMRDYSDFTVVDIAGCGAHETRFCWDQATPHGHVDYLCREVRLEDANGRFDSWRLIPAARLSLLQRLASAGTP